MSFLFGKRINNSTAAERIGAFQSTTCEFGTPLPLLYGTVKRSPNLINFQDFTTKERKTTTKTGKRSSGTQIDYEYSVYIELALCEGIIDGIKKVWVGNNEYKTLAEFNAKAANQGAPLSLNRGDNPNPTTYMATKHSDIAVGYGNMAYLHGFVFLGTNAASTPSYSFEINGLLRASGDGVDANPADIIMDMLQRIRCAEYIDAESFENYRNYCKEADLLVSTPADAFTDQKKCQEVIKELLAITNSYMFWSVDRFKIVPRDDRPRGNWRPNTTVRYDLTTDEMAEQGEGACVVYTRKDSSEIYNRFGVQFTNRENEYEGETIFYEDTEDIIENGAKTASDFSAKWIHTAERAVKVAEIRARVNRTETIKYTFKLDWKYGLLEPGDLLTLTEEIIGLDRQLVMVDSVTENKKGFLTVTALRREAAAGTISYEIQENGHNTINYNTAPGNVAVPLIITPPIELVTASTGLELWLAIHGQSENWGGCDVYISTKDGNYTLHGRHGQSSTYGNILTDLTADGNTVDVQFTNVRPVAILEGSETDAANGLTDIWINGEFLAYTGSQLIGNNSYRLTGLIRGKYGTTAAAHTNGESVALIDSDLFCIQMPKTYLGKQMYIKLPSFNTMKNNMQELNDIDYYSHTVGLYEIPNVQKITVDSKRYAHTSGLSTYYTYDIIVKWDPPEWDLYNSAKVYYKKESATEWIYAGMGLQSLTIKSIADGGDYQISVVVRDMNGNHKAPKNGAKATITLN